MAISKKDLMELQRIWYEKLKASGFEDIEDTTRSDLPLKSWHNFRFKKNSFIGREATTVYFTKAVELLHVYVFLNATHRVIWELHATRGWSKRQIERAIKDMTPSYKREQIGNIIRMIAKEIL